MEKGFTLVIPLYNKVHCVRQTLDSVLNNHGEYPFKCLIIDDDSTDGSSQIGEEYDTKYPDVFTYYKIKHHGKKTPIYARNLGIKLAETEYIGFLDADDELCGGFIDRGCTFLDNHPEYSLYGNGHITCEYNKDNEKYYLCHLAASDNIRDFETYVLNGGINIHYSSHVYKTELANTHPFTDCFNEDVIFKLKYIYYNSPIYFDNSTYEGIIWNIIYRQSNLWNRDCNLNKLFEILKKEIPDFEYDVTDVNGYNFNLINNNII